VSIWDVMFGRRSLTLTDPGGWNFGLPPSASGKSVTPDSAMQLAAAWACVRLKSRTVGTLPIAVYEKLTDGTRREASGHWLYGLVHDSPNADQTAAEFWQGMVACIDLWGNAYAKKEVGAGGRVTSLTPLRSDRMQVFVDQTGARRYRYSNPWGAQDDWTEEEVFHIRGFTVGGPVGLSAISYGRQTLGAAAAADEAAAKVFANGMMSSGFVQPTLGAKSTPEQRAEMMTLFQKFAGSSQAGRVMPLPDGWAFNPVTMNPEDAQLLETRSFNVEEICRWFDVLPVLIGHAAAGQTMWGSGIEQLMIGWLTLNLRPLLASIEQAIEKQLLPAGMRTNIYPEFNLDGLLRADSAGRAALYSVQAQNGLKTRNEMRRRENDPPLPGGDLLTVQSNLIPLEKLGETPPTPTPDGFGHPLKPAADSPRSAAA
jgi:HK97 family phage portal protein